jgi:RNA 2',3'-cyclic 3'-phosphodiesterase
MRLFIAVFPPPDVLEAVIAAAATLRAESSGVAWVKPENLHFTLRFLGETGAAGAARATTAMQAAATVTPSFEAACGGFGAFPTPRHARVLWVGMGEGAGALTGLAQALERALEHEGFARAERPFAPHLTIGRVRLRDQDWRHLPALTEIGGSFRVDRILLIESVLGPGGSRYASREDARLPSPGAVS